MATGTTEDEPTGLMRFITGGGNPAQLSYETLARRRAIAAALAAKQRAFPKTMGEGMTYLGEALGEMRNDRTSDAMESALAAGEVGVGARAPGGTSGLPPVGAPALRSPVAGAPMAAGAPAAGLPPVNAGQPSPLPPGPVGPLAMAGPPPGPVGPVAAGPPPEEANPQRAKLATLIARLRGEEPPAGQEAPPANPTQGAVVPPQADPLSASAASPGPSGQQFAALGGTASDAPPPGAGVPPLVEENPETPSNIRPAPPVQMAQAGVIPGSVAPPVPAAGVLTPPGGGLFSGVPSTGGPPPGAPSTRPIPDLKEQTMDPPGPEPVRPGVPPPTEAMKYWFPYIDNPRFSPELRARAERVFKAEQAHQTATYAQQQETYKDKREQWQSKTKEYEKFQREKHDRLIDQTIKLHGIEETQTKLEDAYFKQRMPRQQALEKAALDIKEAQRRLAAKPTKEINGVIYEYTDPTPGNPGGWAAAPGSPKKEEKLTEKVQTMLDRYQRAVVTSGHLNNTDELTKLFEVGKGRLPVGGNYWVSDDYRRTKSAADTWLLNMIRNDSGAAIGKDEIPEHYWKYFPAPGDTPHDVASKMVLRRTVEKAWYSGLGEDGRKVADDFHKERGARKTTEPEGSVMLKGGKPFRRVIGGHWEDL